MKKALTDRAIKALKPNGKKQRLRDGLVRGFGYRMSPAGYGSFYFQYTFSGKRREIVIETKTLVAARDRASRYRLLVKDGIDPLLQAERRRESEEAERAEREAVANEPTVSELIKRYLKKDLSERTVKNRKNKLASFKKAFGDRRVRTVTSVEIMRLVDGCRADAQRTAIFSAINACLNCIKHGELDGWRNPLHEVKTADRPQYDGTRDRTLSADEINTVWQACEGVKRHASPIIRLLLLTGQRIEEVAGLRWSEIDLRERIWTLPPERIKTRKKRNHAHIIPLSDSAIEIINSQPVTGDLMFAGHSGKKPITADAVFRLKEKIVADAEMENFQLRDIRRSVKTHMIRTGITNKDRSREAAILSKGWTSPAG